MKKRFAGILCVLIAIVILSSCEIALESGKQSEMISTLSTTVSGHSISFAVADGRLRVYGSFADDTYGHLLVMFNRDQTTNQGVPVSNRQFDTTMDIPQTGDEILVELYGGAAEYGNFGSIILDFVKLVKNGESWGIMQSPVYAQNMEIYNRAKDIASEQAPSASIQSTDVEIVALADMITANCSSDYDKVKAIHDWVARNIYYDYDTLRTGDYSEMDALGVLHNRRGVCEGYANLFAALVRSRGIACRVQSGFALGISTDKTWSDANVNTTESNHAWNEAYVDGRWMMIDATWDSQNTYENGSYTTGAYVTDIYFDSTMEFFSLSHKLMEEQNEILYF